MSRLLTRTGPYGQALSPVYLKEANALQTRFTGCRVNLKY